MSEREREKAPLLVAAAVLGFLLFNYPILAIFDLDARVLGVPVLWAYLFTAWASLIVLAAVIVRRMG
jgi:hypothetical protein